MICDIEAGKKSPTIRVLGQLAAGMGLSISDLLEAEVAPKADVCRRPDQRLFTDPESGVERRLVSPALMRRGIEVIEYNYPDQTGIHDFPPHREGAVELAFVLEGHVRLHIAHESVDLKAGDSMTYDANVVHGETNLGPGTARVLFIIDYTRTARASGPCGHGALSG